MNSMMKPSSGQIELPNDLLSRLIEDLELASGLE
jgi:hypothetical protein